MLKKLEIKGLFGLYDYTLDFTENSENGLTIITGPNGYGKTTLFQLVYALFRRDVATFLSVPFSVIVFSLEDEIIRVRQQRTITENEEQSDLPPDEDPSAAGGPAGDVRRNRLRQKSFG